MQSEQDDSFGLEKVRDTSNFNNTSDSIEAAAPPKETDAKINETTTNSTQVTHMLTAYSVATMATIIKTVAWLAFKIPLRCFHSYSDIFD